MGPMGNISMADETGRPSNKMIQYFAERARGGAGLITTGLVPVTFALTLPSWSLVTLPICLASIAPGQFWLAGGHCRERPRLWGQVLCPAYTGGGAGRFPGVRSEETPAARFSFVEPQLLPAKCPCRPLTDRELRKTIRAAGQAAATRKLASPTGSISMATRATYSSR